MNKIQGTYCEILSRCNSNCPYCYNAKNISDHSELSIESIRKIAQELRKLGSCNITLSGGEPFLRNDLYEILECLEDECMEVAIISNGTCFNNIIILKRFQPHLQLTFDGYNPETHDRTRGKGNFDCLLNGIKNSREKGFESSIAIRVNITMDNYRFVEQILNMLEAEFGSDHELINTIDIALVHANGTFPKDKILPYECYDNLANTIDKWNSKQSEIDSFTALYEFTNPDIGCPYNGENGSIDCGIRIDSKGEVYPCQLFSDTKFSIGNINNASLEEIISSTKMEVFVKEISSRKMNDSCKNCVYQAFCGCGCPAKAYMESGQVFSSSHCKERKLMFLSNIKGAIHGV